MRSRQNAPERRPATAPPATTGLATPGPSSAGTASSRPASASAGPAGRGNAFAQERLAAKGGTAPVSEPASASERAPASEHTSISDAASATERPAAGASPRPFREYPHRAAIERALGLPIAGRAVVDPDGCSARDVPAFAEGDVVHFADDLPSLRVAAHEATHLLHHAGKAGQGEDGPEEQAESVADLVEDGVSAKDLLGGERVQGTRHDYTKSAKASSEKSSTKSSTKASATSSEKTSSGTSSKAKKKPYGLISYYDPKDADDLCDAMKKSGLPKEADVYMGTYGVDAKQAEKVHAAGGKYAPAFSLVRTTKDANGKKKDRALYTGRSTEVEGDDAYAGRVPTLSEIKKLKGAQSHAYRWGLEVGRRMRDTMRTKMKQGVVDSWQLDEVWPSMSKAAHGGPALTREYMRGVMEGLANGRPQLQDKLVKGIVHIAHMDRLASLGTEGEMKKFWKSLDGCTEFIVAEEYPAFRGSPEAAAEKADGAVDRLAKNGKHGKGLSKKVVAGLTPGFRKGSNAGIVHLGGQQKGQSEAKAKAWQDRYTDARAKDGIAGVSQFNWLGGNDEEKHMASATKDMAETARQIG